MAEHAIAIRSMRAWAASTVGAADIYVEYVGVPELYFGAHYCVIVTAWHCMCVRSIVKPCCTKRHLMGSCVFVYIV